jgi:hypothetical protein
MCMGAQDPTVFATNTSDMATYIASKGAGSLMTVMNVEDSATVGPTLAGAFAAAKAATAADPSAGATPAERVVGAYHGGLVPPFCNVAVRTYFQGVLAAGL